MEEERALMSQIPSAIMYKYHINNGIISETSTQTSQEVVVISSKKEDDKSFEIEEITRHETKGKRMGVVFLAKRKGYELIRPLRSHQVVRNPNGKQALRTYLLDLQIKNINRFDKMMSNEPTLANYLKENDNSE